MPQCPSLYSHYGLMQLVITPLPTHSLLFLTHTLTQCHMFPSVGVWMYSITGFHQPREISLHSSFPLSSTCCVFHQSHTHLLPPFPYFVIVLSLFSLPISSTFSSSFPSLNSSSILFSLAAHFVFLHLFFCPSLIQKWASAGNAACAHFQVVNISQTATQSSFWHLNHQKVITDLWVVVYYQMHYPANA